MTVGELKKAIALLHDAMEIEIIARYEDCGAEVANCFDLETISAELDPDTAREYARFECVEPE